jgi:hypothetical protein
VATEERTEFGFTRTRCDCGTCIANCEGLPGYLIPGDLKRLLPPDVYEDEEKAKEFAREHFRASNATEIIRCHHDGRKEHMHVGTLVPTHRENGSCHYLENDRCTIHAIAPFGCAFFDCRQSKQQADAISSRGISAIIADRDAGGLYSRLWASLWKEGLQAPDIAFRKAAVAASGARRDRELRRRRPRSPLL